MRIFLFISIVPLILTAAMACIARGSSYPDQRVAGMIMWLFIALAALLSLNAGGLSWVFGGLITLIVSAAGYFLDDLLQKVFPALPPQAPTE